MVIARGIYVLIDIAASVVAPYQLNPSAWGWGVRAGFFWGGTCLLTFVWAFFRLPEIKGRTYEELDILFANKTPARKFASTHVDAYASASPEVCVTGGKDF